MGKNGDFSPEVVAALEAFMKLCKPVETEREGRYYMTTSGIATEIRKQSGDSDFSIDDAYNFMLKAVYRMQRIEENKAMTFCFYARYNE